MRISSSKRHLWKWLLGGFTLLVVLGAAYVGIMLVLPVPRPQLHMVLRSGVLDTGKPTTLPWPVGGGAALGSGTGVLAANNADQQFATASISKVVLALTVLKEKPLKLGETGPVITLTSKDVGFYQDEIDRGGSTVDVATGENITEYQALQALLLSSGNNIADSLAAWAFGSEQQYTQRAQALLAGMGLTKTTIADASGYSAHTVSTPAELVRIGEIALASPVIAQIVAQKSATIPVVGEVLNTNKILGQGGINGIKTGHTYQAGGCLLFSATRQVAGRDVTLVGAVQSMPDLAQVFEVTSTLLDAGFQNFVTVTSVAAGQPIGTVTMPWGDSVNVVAKQAITQTIWAGTPLNREVVAALSPAGLTGHVKVADTSTDLMLAKPLTSPSPIWRLTHPVEMIGNYFRK